MTTEFQRLIDENQKPAGTPRPVLGCWCIQKDRTGEPDQSGTVGPALCQLSAATIQNHPSAHFFQMKDDDGNIYYRGWCIHDGGEEMFAPLDDFGQPNAGCTSIEYQKTTIAADGAHEHKWERI